jgi:SAM-dependent methyltransferase
MITVDVEAQAARAVRDPLQTLVWGEFSSGSFGIQSIMAVAEQHDAALTMFLDYAEEQIYGDALLDIGREIHRRDHDLQLHLHPEFLDTAFYEENGIARVADLSHATATDGQVLAAFLCDAHVRTTGVAPIAFRGGGYRYSLPLLQALNQEGVKVNSSYNPTRSTQPLALGLKHQFCWGRGMYEIPIAVVAGFQGREQPFDYNFNASTFIDCSITRGVERHVEFLDQFFDQQGDEAVAVLVLHSWSFLRRNAAGQFVEPNLDAPERLDTLLSALSSTTSFITATDAVDLFERDVVEVEDSTRDDGVVALPPTIHSPRDGCRATGEGDSTRRCSICGTRGDLFVDADTSGRKCVCGSLERQRVFADLYSAERFDFQGADVLAVAPSTAELRLFEEYGVGSVTRVDIRPEASCDFIADVCDMPEVPDRTYDIVFASHVLTHVYDLQRSLAEFARILVPGGSLFSTDPIAEGRPTLELTDPDKIASWYGDETLKKYRVGTFRRLGSLDTVRELERYFSVRVFRRFDAVTGRPVVWHVGVVECS